MDTGFSLTTFSLITFFYGGHKAQTDLNTSVDK